MIAQASLFEPALLPGLAYRPDLITADEERELAAALGALPLAPFQFHGWEGKRQVLSFGWRYDFAEANLSRSEPIPSVLLPLRDRAAAFAGVAPEELVHALVARYDPGATIGWHRDRPVFETVVGVSLLAAASIRFRRRREDRYFDRFALPVAPRSAYALTGEARHGWEHSIAALPDCRWSVTFRTLSDKGRRIIAGGTA